MPIGFGGIPKSSRWSVRCRPWCDGLELSASRPLWTPSRGGRRRWTDCQRTWKGNVVVEQHGCIGSAGLHAVLILSTITTTSTANHIFLYLDRLGCTFGDLFKIQFDLDPDICSPYATATTTRAASSTTTTAAKKTSEWTIISKNISELTEDIIHIHTGPTAKTTAAITTPAECLVAKAVVLSPLIRVA